MVADFEAQSSPDCSPVKWHLAHTTWFFEAFVLERFAATYTPFCEAFHYLFNSYYTALGPRQLRAERGLLSRPTLKEVWDYRRHVEEQVLQLLESSPTPELLGLVELGCHHEQQHQELILTDIKSLFSKNRLAPAYCTAPPPALDQASELRFEWYPGGLIEVGAGSAGFAFDNERPRHEVLLQPFALAQRPVSNAEFAEFVDAGGYKRPELWLDAGYHWVQSEQIAQPVYWRGGQGSRSEFTLSGERDIVPGASVCHLSYFEADAFARFAGARLPRETEWEHVASQQAVDGNFAESKLFHPQPARAAHPQAPAALFGDVWEWTSSSYGAYPGFQIAEGAVGEYNGKFMCGQFVLKGGSCATPRSHVRATYRNFFHPPDRWQFSGLRLAKDTP